MIYRYLHILFNTPLTLSFLYGRVHRLFFAATATLLSSLQIVEQMGYHVHQLLAMPLLYQRAHPVLQTDEIVQRHLACLLAQTLQISLRYTILAMQQILTPCPAFLRLTQTALKTILTKLATLTPEHLAYQAVKALVDRNQPRL